MSAASERQLAESVADSTVPRRGVDGIDHRWLTPEERARLVVTDPYKNGRAARQATTEMVELQMLTGAQSRTRVPCATAEQRARITQMVEDGQAAFTVTRPGWFTPSGRFKTHQWAQPMEPFVSPALASAEQARLERALTQSAQRAQAEFVAAHGAPSTVPSSTKDSIYRPPSAS